MIDPFADIVDFLPALEPHFRDETVSEVMINADGGAFVERSGLLEELPFRVTARELCPVVQRIASNLGKWIDAKDPLLEARLADGSRVAAACTPVSRGWSICVRKFPTIRYSAADLVTMGAITSWQLDYLRAAIEARKNVLISGGTGTGKTTILNALAEFIPDDHRILLLEDVSEIVLPASKTNVERLEARREQDGMKAVTITDLLRHALRMRPDRVILGEVRGAEAFDLLQVLNSGHQGTISTLHADDARKALDRLTSMVMQSKVVPSPISVRGDIGASVNVIVQAERGRDGRRRVSEIAEMEGYAFSSDTFKLHSISEPQRKPVAEESKMEVACRRLKSI